MTTVTLKAYVYVRQDYDGKPEFNVFGFDVGEHDVTFGARAGVHEFEFTLPADFSVTAAEIARLEAELAEAAEKFRETQQRINLRISKLQAITNEVPA